MCHVRLEGLINVATVIKRTGFRKRSVTKYGGIFVSFPILFYEILFYSVLCCAVLFYSKLLVSNLTHILSSENSAAACALSASSRLVASETLLFNCWHALPWVMKCIWIQGVCSKSVRIWHSSSPDALQLITLSNLVLMCRCSVSWFNVSWTAVTPNRLGRSTVWTRWIATVAYCLFCFIVCVRQSCIYYGDALQCILCI